MSELNIPTQNSTFGSSLFANGKDSPVSADPRNNNEEWGYRSNGLSCCHELSPMNETMQAEMSIVQSGLDGHLPLLHDTHLSNQDGLLGLRSAEAYLSSRVECRKDDGDSAGPLFEKRKRSRSTGSRHRFSEVVTELLPEEVRWFYKDDKRTWKPFVGVDSLEIEHMYRKYCELYRSTASFPVSCAREKCDGKGEESRGLRVETRTSFDHGGLAYMVTDTPSSDVRDPDGIEIDSDPVCVLEGLYEVDVKERTCYPIYWKPQDRIPIMRGHWFVDGTWLPLEEEESDLIEQEHLRQFRGQQTQDISETDMAVKTVDSKDAIHSLKLSRNHVDWHSVDEVYLYSDATTSKIARTVTQKLGFSKVSSSGTRLHRGYVMEASPEERPPQTTHVVFVIHGIGYKTDQERIIRNTGQLREGVRKMEEKHFAEYTDEHVEFLPVKWRSKLSLDGDTVESITPDKVRGLRDLLNSSAMDIMYYNSPLYRNEITMGLTQELNRLYTLFCSRNPKFEESGGKVSIVSHSLGCVITYDIMTGWDPVRFCLQEHHAVEDGLDQHELSYEKRYLLEQQRLTRIRLRELESELLTLEASKPLAPPALQFKVENLFCMGSPLAVFLALRGIRPGNNGHQDHILPTTICNRLFNVFHPTDPVAYRLEPLIFKHYSNIAPIQIHWCSATNPTPYDEIRPTLLNPVKDPTSDNESIPIPSPSTSPVLVRRHYGESITNLGKASILGAASIGKGIGGIFLSRFSRSNSQPLVSIGLEGGTNAEEEELKRTESQSAYGLSTMTQPTSPITDVSLELERRIDFELREGLVESRYWSAVTSHTGYWCSHDIALFLLTFIYKQKTPPSHQAEDTADLD